MENKTLLRQLYDKYGLNYDESNPNSKENDIFVHKHYKIITRGGIQKIEKAANLYCDIQVVDSISEANNVTMRGTGRAENGQIYHTFASASFENCTNKYYAEMAEKRCRSRLVLTLAGLYELGVFGEDEADAFSKVVQDQTSSVKTASYRAN